MRNLNYDFKNLCQRNRDGSFATQHDRESILTLIANQLDEDGFRHLRATGVRSKHVEHRQRGVALPPALTSSTAART